MRQYILYGDLYYAARGLKAVGPLTPPQDELPKLLQFVITVPIEIILDKATKQLDMETAPELIHKVKKSINEDIQQILLYLETEEIREQKRRPPKKRRLN
jgi:hypothetical protein